MRKLWRLGFQASLEEVVTVGGALQHWLSERRDGGASAFVIGSGRSGDHVEEAGLRIVNRTDLATRADVVVVGGHEDFAYAELRTATQAVLRGAGLVGAHAATPRSRCPTARGRGRARCSPPWRRAAGATAVERGKAGGGPVPTPPRPARRGQRAGRGRPPRRRPRRRAGGRAGRRVVLTGATTREEADAATRRRWRRRHARRPGAGV